MSSGGTVKAMLGGPVPEALGTIAMHQIRERLGAGLTDAAESFGERLRRVMAERRTSGAALARALDCSQQAVSKWMRGGNIDDGRLRELAVVLNVDWLWLRYGDEIVKERVRADALNSVDELRVETFRKLMLAEERLYTALEAALLGTWEWDISSNTVALSERAASLLKLGDCEKTVSLERFLGVIHPRDLRLVRDTVEATVRNQERFQIDFRLVVPGGVTRWVFLAGGFVADRQTGAVRGMGTCKDISGRKHVEENLRRERDYYLRVWERSSTLLIIVNAQGCVLRSNKTLRKLLGYGSEFVNGREFCELLAAYSKDKPHYYHEFDFKSGRYPKVFQTALQSRNGATLHVTWFVENLGRSVEHLICGHVVADTSAAANCGLFHPILPMR